MGTIEENKSAWDCQHNWIDAGEGWSSDWGGSYMQWYGTILPRIRKFLPVCTILEIAPGFGRWTEYLKDFCTNLIVVDLSEKCIKACQKRFANCSHISYFVNDGKSLEMIPDNTIDFVFSFDSLVHADDTVISSYVSQFPRKLKQNGAVFLHHSNLGEYSNYLKMLCLAGRAPKLLDILKRLGIVDEIRKHDRDPSMTAKKMQLYAEDNGLQCISQELINWRLKRALIDCMSTIVKKDSIYIRNNKVFRNASFMKEVRQLAILSQLYDLQLKK
jgi:2-polyprenyl-3-methyl-5-hydroxy-6-metoxy-1,4-benzoquinol methylase